jgi:dienelactone hydrolase
LLLACVAGAASSAIDERVVIDSDGWVLVGEWRAPASETPVPAALLLHRAAGSREEYADLASALASRGVASLRLDLRAHGESDGLGRFEEPSGERVAVVGASYSGEAIGEALRAGGDRAAAYVLLSPGSLSTESIAAVDSSGASWLFIRTSEEGEVSLPFIDAVFDELAAKSRSAEVRVVPGVGHATGIFDEHPFMIEEIADWLAERLAVVGVRTEAPPSNLAAVARLTRSACWSSE